MGVSSQRFQDKALIKWTMVVNNVFIFHASSGSRKWDSTVAFFCDPTPEARICVEFACGPSPCGGRARVLWRMGRLVTVVVLQPSIVQLVGGAGC